MKIAPMNKKCIMKSKLSSILFLVFFPFVSLCQTDIKDIYILFKENSKIQYNKKGEMGKIYRENTYVENKSANGDIDFFIEGLLFRHDKDKMQRKILSKSDLTCKELLSPKQIKTHINSIKEEYPLGYKYPNKEFPLLYIAKEKKDSIVLYEVKWQSYVE